MTGRGATGPGALGPDSGSGMVPADPARGRELWAWGAACLAAALALGVWLARDPTFLHLDGAPGPEMLMALVVVLGIAAGILHWPGVGLVLLVGAVYLNLSEVLVRQHDLPSFLQILAVPLLLAALVERARGLAPSREGVPRGHGLLLVLLAAHALTVLLSTTVAIDRPLADERFIEVLKGMGLVVLLVLLATTRRRLRSVAWTLLGTGALLASLAVVQTATGDFGSDFGGLARVKDAHIHGNVFQPRVAGPLGDPNYFAQILLVLVPLALFMGWEESTRGRRTLAFAAGGVIATGVVLTYSRGGALALGAVLVASFLVRGVNLRGLAVGFAALVAVLYVLPQDFTARVATVTQVVPGHEEEVLEQDSSFQERLLLAGVAWEMYRDHPVLGVGAGNYTVHFDDYVDRVGSTARDYGSADDARYSHNLYLELGAEGGALVLLSFLAVMGAVLVLLNRARRRFLAAGDPFLGALATALALGLAGYLVSSVFLHGHFQRYLWLVVGLGAAVYALRPSPDADPPGSPPGSHEGGPVEALLESSPDRIRKGGDGTLS